MCKQRLWLLDIQFPPGDVPGFVLSCVTEEEPEHRESAGFLVGKSGLYPRRSHSLYNAGQEARLSLCSTGRCDLGLSRLCTMQASLERVRNQGR